ncbi:2'-5' RNA ligase family protein [Planosporangium sp. 12N6]|uniref:2'-5' RNA ligase family protein n=1 Tax=Planosporangium spinosum TaxID=3402278 RepID=UPI003CEB57DC
MTAALELYFDATAERRIHVLWNALAAAEVPTLRQISGRHRPHLSLVGAELLDAETVVRALRGLPVAPPLPLSFQYTGQFVGRVLFLGPAPNADLLAHQAEVWRRLSEAGVALSELYAPGVWVPHATMSMRVPRPALAEAIRRCLEFLPIEATISAAAVVDHKRDIRVPLR